MPDYRCGKCGLVFPESQVAHPRTVKGIRWLETGNCTPDEYGADACPGCGSLNIGETREVVTA